MTKSHLLMTQFLEAIIFVDKTLKVAPREHLEQIPAATVKFVQATFVLVTFVHITTVAGPILTKL